MEMANTGHLVGPGRRPQSRILGCMYLLKARVTCVGAPDGCCIACSELGKGAPSKAGKSVFRAASLWWRCAQYFVIASCG